MRHATKLLLAAAALATATTTAWAEKTWKYGSAAQPGTVLIKLTDDMASRFSAATKGDTKLERLFVGSEQEIMQQVVRGRLEMGSVSYTGASVLIPEAGLLNMPYLWKSNAERDFVTDVHALPVLKKIYASKGLIILSLGEVGWNDVVCKTACLTPASVKGMKVRVSPSAASKMFWGSLQANGVQMPLSELFPALQSGLVEGADLPFPYYVTTPAAQSAPHYVLTQHLHHGSTIFINKAVWDKTPADQQKMLIDSMPPVDVARKAVDDELKPKMEEFKKNGGFIHELTDAQRAEWRKLVEPNQEDLVKAIGGSANELWAAIKQGKAEFAKRGGK